MQSTDKEQRLDALHLCLGTGRGTTRSCCTAANIRITSHSPKSFFIKRALHLTLSIEREKSKKPESRSFQQLTYSALILPNQTCSLVPVLALCAADALDGQNDSDKLGINPP